MSSSLANAILKNNRKLLKKPHLPYMGKKPVGGVARKKEGSYTKVSEARLKRILLHKKRQRRIDGLQTLLISILIIVGLTLFFWFVLG
ncbi:hypothetical protein [Spongiivirga citrea]|uniref:Uncharacterized protein n=1 Tax=Spongiivirga citrea TaxID=1481457 RepID=A0A6M0CFR6_9FLAO|nr:hypothetical protein [Spongiivirga citrea]NER16282.1 hypothetical protein [Spongiivirga citrea]